MMEGMGWGPPRGAAREGGWRFSQPCACDACVAAPPPRRRLLPADDDEGRPIPGMGAEELGFQEGEGPLPGEGALGGDAMYNEGA